MKKILVSAILILGFSSVAHACKGSAEHNRKYHGDAQCSQCTCYHYRDHDHGNGTDQQARSHVPGYLSINPKQKVLVKLLTDVPATEANVEREYQDD